MKIAAKERCHPTLIVCVWYIHMQRNASALCLSVTQKNGRYLGRWYYPLELASHLWRMFTLTHGSAPLFCGDTSICEEFPPASRLNCHHVAVPYARRSAGAATSREAREPKKRGGSECVHRDADSTFVGRADTSAKKCPDAAEARAQRVMRLSAMARSSRGVPIPNRIPRT